MTLRSRLFAAFVVVVSVPLLVGLVLLASTLPRTLAEPQEDAVVASARLGAQLLTAECDRARAVAEAAGRAVLAVPADDRTAQRAALRSLVERGLATGVRVEDEAGRMVSAGSLPDEVGDCAAGAAVPGPVTAVARLDLPGAAAGSAVAAGRPLSRLLDDARPAAQGSVALVDGAGARAVEGDATLSPELARAAVASPGEVVRRDGALAVAAPLAGGSPLAVVAAEPVREGVDVVRTGLLVVLGAVVLAAAVAPVLARATTRPLEELSLAAARIASGDLDSRIELRSRDEVGRLAQAFGAMTDELRDHIGQLEHGRRELRAGLARLGETLTSTHDLDRMLAVVLETAVVTSGARAGAVLLLDARRESLELAAGHALEGRAAPGRFRVRRGEGIVGRVARTARAEHGLVADLQPAPQEPVAESLIAVPLRTDDDVLGVLVVYDVRGGGQVPAEDLETVRTLARQAAVAVDNVLRHRDVSRLAATDGLTGLANYRSFTATVDREVERASRFGRPLALLLLDIDHFKAVNDTHGHQRGDAVLVELARRVRREVRDVDTVARYGGEELVVVLPETDRAGAEQAAERSVSDAPFTAEQAPPVTVTVSLGVALLPAAGGSATALLRRADQALYEAKRAGRDTWRTASEQGG